MEKFLVSVFAACVATAIYGLILLLMWNWLMPAIFGLPTITWLQACGLTLLSSCLFKQKINITKN